jgi:hypothetical protein
MCFSSINSTNSCSQEIHIVSFTYINFKSPIGQLWSHVQCIYHMLEFAQGTPLLSASYLLKYMFLQAGECRGESNQRDMCVVKPRNSFREISCHFLFSSKRSNAAANDSFSVAGAPSAVFAQIERCWYLPLDLSNASKVFPASFNLRRGSRMRRCLLLVVLCGHCANPPGSGKL